MSKSAKVLGEVEEALNRFAKQTNEDGSALSVEFKNFNKRRVDDFVHEPYNNFKHKEAVKEKRKNSRLNSTKTKTDIAGLNRFMICCCLLSCTLSYAPSSLTVYMHVFMSPILYYTTIYCTVGIFEYAGPDKYTAPITDGAIPEYSRSMGPRTRFGDGDGSFWDKWVGAGHEPPGKGMGYDVNRIPLQR